MSSTLQVTFSVRFVDANNLPLETIQTPQTTVTMTATEMAAGIQTVGTSTEAVVTTDVATLGFGYFRNMDATNYVELGPDATGIQSFTKLKPGEWCWLPLTPGITIDARANAAPVKLQYYVFGR